MHINEKHNARNLLNMIDKYKGPTENYFENIYINKRCNAFFQFPFLFKIDRIQYLGEKGLLFSKTCP